MVRYGISSDRAASLLVQWAHEAGYTVADTAHTLMLGLCGGDQLIGAARPTLLRWLSGQLRVELPEAPTVTRTTR